MSLPDRRTLIAGAVVVLVASSLAVAAGSDRLRTEMSAFEATGPAAFHYRVAADGAGFDAPDDAVAERARLAWLAAWLAETEMCPKGYRIAERRVSERHANAFGTVWDVDYDGACLAGE